MVNGLANRKTANGKRERARVFPNSLTSLRCPKFIADHRQNAGLEIAHLPFHVSRLPIMPGGIARPAKGFSIYESFHVTDYTPTGG
jgi:hypothetical protein